MARGDAANCEAEDAIALSADCGLALFEWQRHVLEDWCAADTWWRPSHTTCGLDVPRQNGKNAALEGYELYRLAVCGWHILHTAHRVKTAKKAFRRLCRYFEDDEHPELKELVVQIRRTNGEEAIYLSNGASIEFIARTNGSARGFDDIQLVVFDEAQELTDEQFDAIMYTLAASATGERQIIYTGTPPNEKSPGTVFPRVRKAALGDSPPNKTAWSSWAIPRLPPRDAKFEDLIDEIYRSNPSMGLLLDLDFTESEFAGGSVEGFAHERLGWFSEKAGFKRAISAGVWAGSAIAAIGKKYKKKTALAVKFSPDGATYALAGAKVSKTGEAAVELIEVGTTASGTEALAQWLYDARGRVCAVAVDGLDGAEALCSRLEELKAPRGFAMAPKTADFVSACSRFHDELKSGKCAHTSSPLLEDSAEHSFRRAIGNRGGWGFAASEAHDPAPMEACALALWAARTTKRDPKRRQMLL